MEGPKILVIRLSAVGDVIRTLPAVQALKKQLPPCRITWVVEEPSKTFLESQPEIDEVILFPRKELEKAIRSPLRWSKAVRQGSHFLKRLRQRQFDLAFDFHGILKSGLIAWLSGAPTRIGFDRRSTKEGNAFFSNLKVELPREKISRFERNLLLLRGMGLDVKEVKPYLTIPSEDGKWADLFFGQFPEPLPKPLVAIHPWTSPKTPYKRWLADRYSRLADRLVEELGAGVIFTWGPGELEWVEKIKKEMKTRSFLAPKTESLTQLGEIFRRCDLYIGGDTGPIHLASLVGTPVVAIFGPTDPVVNEPLGLHKMVRKDVACSPCRNYFCKDLVCMRSITVEEVFHAAQDLLTVSVSQESAETGRTGLNLKA